jgi:hypothetical protein
VIDENTSRTYWYNEHTGESLWTMPEDPSPTIPSVLAATLAADPPLNLRDVSKGESESVTAFACSPLYCVLERASFEHEYIELYAHTLAPYNVSTWHNTLKKSRNISEDPVSSHAFDTSC